MYLRAELESLVLDLIISEENERLGILLCKYFVL